MKSGSHWLHIRQESRHVTSATLVIGANRAGAWCGHVCAPPLVRGVGSPGWGARTAWGWADTRGLDASRDDTFGRPKRCEDATPRPNPRRFEPPSLPNQHPEPAAVRTRDHTKPQRCSRRSQRRTVTCYLPRSDPQCHGAKIEKEADQGRGDAESPVRGTLRSCLRRWGGSRGRLEWSG